MTRHKVILVEDEVPARMVFKQMIEKRTDLFEFAGEASDGHAGLDLFHQHSPHFVITDITMPGMGGLEFLSELSKSKLPLPKTIILTCHEDFHFAQQAMHLGAASYLIKDDCLTDPELLAKTMERFLQEIIREQKSSQMQNQLEQKLRNNEIDIEKSFFLDMLRGQDLDWLHHLESSHYPVSGKGFILIILEMDRKSLRFSIDQSEELKIWQFAGVNVLQELLTSFGPNKVIALEKGRFFAICSTDQVAIDLSKQILQIFTSHLKLNCYVLQTYCRTDLKDAIPMIKRAYHEPYLFFYHRNPRIETSTREILESYHAIPQEDIMRWAKIMQEAFMEQHLKPSALSTQSTALFQLAADKWWHPEQVKSVYLSAFSNVVQLVDKRMESIDVNAVLLKDLSNCQTYWSVHETISTYFDKFNPINRKSHIDVSITAIIQNMNEDLSKPYKLEDLAASINYSVPYFSSMFKKVTGESFNQYVMRIRIEKAKLLLLTTELKTFEIAHSIGLSNYRHFNRIFKKMIGCNPSEFRHKQT